MAALIGVESHSSLFAHELDKLQESLRVSPAPTGLQYVAEADDAASEEFKRLVAQRRAESLRPVRIVVSEEELNDPTSSVGMRAQNGILELRSHNAVWYQWFDGYHRLERGFRSELEQAKAAAADAADELDSADSAPLDRTTTKIREDLQSLGGSVPSPVTYGDYPPTDPAIPRRMLERLQPISVWIDRIRALLVPRPPAMKRMRPVAPSAPDSEPEVLPTLYREVLVTMLRLGAFDGDHPKTAELIALKTLYSNEPGRIKNPLADLARWGLVDSRTGRRGGSWLTSKGRARAEHIARDLAKQ